MAYSMSPLSEAQKNLVFMTVPRLVGTVLPYAEGKAIVALASSGKEIPWADKDDLIKGMRRLEQFVYDRNVHRVMTPPDVLEKARKVVVGVAVRNGFEPQDE